MKKYEPILWTDLKKNGDQSYSIVHSATVSCYVTNSLLYLFIKAII